MRSRELHGRITQLHRGFRMRHCFRFWHLFAARNRKLRAAWASAAVSQVSREAALTCPTQMPHRSQTPMQIEALIRYSFSCLKANWQQAKMQRRLKASAFRCA
jgi:hypothetical protein